MTPGARDDLYVAAQPGDRGKLLHEPGSARSGFFYEFARGEVSERIPNLGPVFAAAHDPQLIQDAEMLGHVLVGRSEFVPEVLHSSLPLPQSFQDANAVRLSNRLHPPRHKI